MESDAQMCSLSPAQAQAVLKFLGSAQIAGAEAPVFMECVMALRMIVAPPPIDAPVQPQ